jgi:hypothetical protein
MNSNPVVVVVAAAVVVVVAVVAAGCSSTETVLGTSLPGLDKSCAVQVAVVAAAYV